MALSTHTFVVTVATVKPIDGLADKVGDRLWSMDGLNHRLQQPVQVAEVPDAKAASAANDLLMQLKNMRRAYVNLLESGRDRILFLGGQCDHIDTMVATDPNLRAAEAAIAKATGVSA